MPTLPALDAIVQAEIQPHAPGAAVAVVQNGEVIHASGYGLADVEWDVPIGTDTVFRLASVSKQFTATAIMMLIEQGKLSVNDPITRFLPRYPMSGHTVTVHHLLNHTSGIFSYTSDPEFGTKMRRDLTPQQLCDEFSHMPFDFKPGTRYEYNNSGYFLLGMIIEQISGQSYADYLQEHIFKPLGMRQSYYLSTEPIIPRRASGYVPAPDGSYLNAPFLSMTQPYAAGSLGSTANDLVLWDKALRENTLISAATLKQMYTAGTLEDGSRIDYGYGWGIRQYQGKNVAEHSGGINGFNTFIVRFYEDGVTVIVLSNRVGFPVAKVAAALARQVMGIAEPTHTAITLDDAALDKIVGNYLYHEVPFPVIRQEDGTLVLKFGRDIPLIAQSATEFYSPDDPDVLVTFGNAQADGFAHMRYQDAFMTIEAERTEPESE
ncbi:MAG TPA: serine hydrolase domain-containing protein [Phototrophicaceae bacterium]|nr:serine hydrolase domain-containing protein [Phototrophicaceae bacterium]